MGPPTPEEIADTDVAQGFLCDLALKHVAQSPEPTTQSIAEGMCLPRALLEKLPLLLSREKMIDDRTVSIADWLARRAGLGAATVSCGFSLRKLFSPMPCTFINSSIFLNGPFFCRYAMIRSAVFAPTPGRISRSFADAVLMLTTFSRGRLCLGGWRAGRRLRGGSGRR